MERNDFIFNTRVYQKVTGDNIDENLILEQATEIMREFEEKLSFFKEESEVSKINKNAGKCFTKVSNDTFEIIKKSIYYSKLTNGLFNITIAPLTEKWEINSENPRVLTKEEVKEGLSLVDCEDIILMENNSTVMLLREGQKIDLGGIAKGYIADKIIEFYKEKNVKSAIVNIGGNIKVLGRKSADKLWNVGVYEPEKHSETSICAVAVENKSVVTSGGYERAFIYNGELYHHIINPITGYPAKTNLKSVTIVSDESIDGDALSTPIFIMGKMKAYEFMRKNKISGVLVTDNDEIVVTGDLLEGFSLLKQCKVLTF